jgi:hypothetical protein
MPVSYPQFLAGETPALPGALVFDFLAAFLTSTSDCTPDSLETCIATRVHAFPPDQSVSQKMGETMQRKGAAGRNLAVRYSKDIDGRAKRIS